MKIITKLLSPLLCVALLAIACEKEQEDTPNPFEGADNHMTSFVLKKGDISYVATISAGTITVSVPTNVSLDGATVEYRLCENAKINPDPAEIDNWESEQLFRVTAYNGTKATYIYTVEKSDLVRDGAVILKTQSEVDAFGQGSYTVINGYLAIGAATGTDTITSLAPLASLKNVGGIDINAMYMGDLTEFEQLETVGELHVLSKSVKAVRFPKLTTARMNINFDATNAIEMLDFPELTVVERSLRIYQVDSLTTVNFPKLQRVLENVTVEGRSGDGKPNLQTIDFPELTSVSGTLTFTNLNKLEQVSAPKLETAGGISLNTSVLTGVNLSALKTVSGNLSITAVVLTDMQLTALTTVEGTLALNAPLLTSLDGLPVLEKVGTFSAVDIPKITAYDVRGKDIGTLSFGSNTLMKTLGITVTGDEVFAGKLHCLIPNSNATPACAPELFPLTVQGIKKVGGLEYTSPTTGSRIRITYIDLSWLEEVDGLLEINYWYLVERIDLSNLRKVGGLGIKNMLSIKDTLKLPELTEITGYTSGTTTAGGFDFIVLSSEAYTTLELPKLKRIEGDLSITKFEGKLATISFPALETITGTLIIVTRSTSYKNPTFKNLSGFGNLKSAAGVTISNFTQLSDFSPLGGVVCSLPGAAKWNISGCAGPAANYTYQAMVDIYCNNE